RDVEIDSIVARTYAKVQASKDEVKETTRQQSARRSPFDDLAAPTATYTDNRFYFNNPDAMGMGQAEFRRRWGNRQLRDNWRFSDMAGTAVASMGTTANTVEDNTIMPDTTEVDSTAWAANLRDTYVESLPDTDVKLA